MTSLGGDLEVDGTVTARQATQAGQAVVLGSDLKIPPSFYEGGGVQKVTYSTGQDFLDALRNSDNTGLFYLSTAIGELEFHVGIARTTESRSSFPAFGCAYNIMSGARFPVTRADVAGDTLMIYFGTDYNETFSVAMLDDSRLCACLF